MGNITGKVVKVQQGTKKVQLQHGEFVNHHVTIQSEDGETVVVKKLAKPNTDGQKLVGQRVRVTYTSKDFENHETGEVNTVHSAAGKDFILLDQKPYTPGMSKGNQKASGTGYNADGARIGMVGKVAVDLAIARGTLTLAGLKQASNDVSDLVEYIESGTREQQEVTQEAKREPSRRPSQQSSSVFED